MSLPSLACPIDLLLRAHRGIIGAPLRSLALRELVVLGAGRDAIVLLGVRRCRRRRRLSRRHGCAARESDEGGDHWVLPHRVLVDRQQRAAKIGVVPVRSIRRLPRPKAVLFDLFHTLVSVPSPATAGELPIPDLLGVPAAEWHRRYYEDDVLGRCVGRVVDAVEAMRLVTRSIDPTVPEERLHAAVESRRRRFETGLVDVEAGMLEALDRLRAADIRIGLVSDAGADDVESWARSPLRDRFDAVVFSYQVGVRKPDSRIYRHALERVNARPAETLFVGDGGSDEHRGARAVGLQTVLVTRLVNRGSPDLMAVRRAHADWEFEDVPAFVEALGL